MSNKSLGDFIAKWTGTEMDGLGFPLYIWCEDENGKPKRVVRNPESGIVIPKFIQVSPDSLTKRQQAILSMGQFIVLRRDPDLKIYVGDSEGNVWQTIILPDDLPALRIDLEELGLNQSDPYGI